MPLVVILRERQRPWRSSCASVASDRIALSPRQFALFRAAENSQAGTLGTMLTRTTTNWTDNNEQNQELLLGVSRRDARGSRFVVVRLVRLFRLVRHKIVHTQCTRSLPTCEKTRTTWDRARDSDPIGGRR